MSLVLFLSCTTYLFVAAACLRPRGCGVKKIRSLVLRVVRRTAPPRGGFSPDAGHIRPQTGHPRFAGAKLLPLRDMAKFFRHFFSKKFRQKCEHAGNQRLTEERHHNPHREEKRGVYIINIIGGLVEPEGGRYRK